MAIYRCEFKIISRAAGHKAVAAAAYRASEKIVDETYGETHDFTRKSNVGATFILAPENAPAWMQDRAKLWNAVEAAERRKDAQLSREVLLSLPHELTDEQREALIRQFVNERFVSRGMIADVAIHGHSPSGDERNYHAHVMLTTRTLTLGTFGPKERSWNGKEFLHETRVAWAEAQNRLFERLGLDLRVDHRSLADQGLDREPEPKLGPNATEALRNGEPEKAGRTIGDYEAVKDRNADRERLKEQLEVIDLALARLDKAQGDRAAEAVAELALRHSRSFEALQDAQREAQLAARRSAMAELRSAAHDARAAHDAYRDELKPSFIRRLGEIVTLKGREAKAERNAKLATFKMEEDRKLNILRARLRAEGRSLLGDHADARDRLREAQAGERDALARQHEQDRMREVDALIERMKARHAQAEGREASQGGSSPSAASPAARPMPEVPQPVPASEPRPDETVPGFDPARMKAMNEEVDRIVAKILDELGHGDPGGGTEGGDKGDGKSGSSSSGGGAKPRATVLPDGGQPSTFTRKRPAGKPAPAPDPQPDQSVPGFDAESLKRMDAKTDEAMARLKADIERGEKAKAKTGPTPAPLPVAKVDPAKVRGGTTPPALGGQPPAAKPPAAPAASAPAGKSSDSPKDDTGRTRGRDSGRGLIPSEGLKPADERKPLTQEEMEKLARREKAIRMKKAREAREARARERDRDRDRDRGPEW